MGMPSLFCRVQIVAVATLVYATGTSVGVGAAQQASCNALELVEPGGPRYNALVCQGVESMDRNEYENAIRWFEDAMSIRLPDVPNFKLFPRLALAYWRSGKQDKALENLEKARLSLLMLIGTYKCQSTPNSFLLVDPLGDVVDGPQVADIRRRMCGAAYENYYGYTEGPFDDQLLDRFLGDARLVENYLVIARTIPQSVK